MMPDALLSQDLLGNAAMANLMLTACSSSPERSIESGVDPDLDHDLDTDFDTDVDSNIHLEAGQSYNDDVALEPIREALNDRNGSPAERAQLMLDYRNHQLADVPLGTVYAMQSGQEGMPIIASGDDKGMHVPLYERLANDESMQEMMANMSTRILDMDANDETIDMMEIFSAVQADAVELAGDDGNTADTNLASLQAMATLANYYKFEGDTSPEDLGVDAALWDQIRSAGETLAAQENPEAAVMNHGVQAAPGNGDFTADRNFHFFSHAYLAATLDHEHGLSDNDAEAMSGFIGSQYELMDHSLSENEGNSGLKDILVNAEGAQFGTSLMSAPDTPLPGQYDGPAPEDRSIGNLPWNDQGEVEMPDDMRAVADEAQDLSYLNIGVNALEGVGSRLWNEGLSGLGDSISDLWR